MITVDELARLFNLSKKGKNLSVNNLGNVESDKDSLLTYAENAFYLKEALNKPNVKVVITKDEFRQTATDKTLLICNNPKYLFFTIHNYLAKETDFYGELQKSKISSLAQIHPKAFIAEKGVFIDDHVIIGPNVTILERTHIEKNVTIQAGAVVGSEGFEYKRMEDKLLPVIHAGGVYLEQGVEIGANNCIDKNIFGDFTRIGQDTKLDNLVHIAHGCQIGKRCLFAACSMLSGSVIIEDDVFIGPASAIRPQVRIGRGATVSIGSVVTKDVPAGTRVTGNFAIEHEKFMAFIKSIR